MTMSGRRLEWSCIPNSNNWNDNNDRYVQTTVDNLNDWHAYGTFNTVWILFVIRVANTICPYINSSLHEQYSISLESQIFFPHNYTSPFCNCESIKQRRTTEKQLGSLTEFCKMLRIWQMFIVFIYIQPIRAEVAVSLPRLHPGMLK